MGVIRLFRRVHFWVATLLFLTGCWRGSQAPDDTARISFSKSAGIDGRWESLGMSRGMTVPDLILFSPEGEPFHLYGELRRGRPVVIFNASYTCDVSRNNLADIETIVHRFGKKADFYVVYTIEPHPADTVSPYSAKGEVWVADKNVQDSVEASQPRTYGERVHLAEQWRDKYQVDASVLVDGPDNYYWSTFGQAPNMAYVIEPNGTVFYKQAWFRAGELSAELDIMTAE